MEKEDNSKEEIFKNKRTSKLMEDINPQIQEANPNRINTKKTSNIYEENT